MKVDPSSVNVNDQVPVNLFVVLGQSSSHDDVKYLLSQLNTSLSQIGEHIAPFKQDMISGIHAHVNKKSAINQQYVITHSNESTFEFSLLINITLSQFKQSFKQFLQSEHKQKYFLNLTFDSNYNGDMNINDSLVTYDDMHSYLTLYHVNSQNIDFIMNQKVFDSNKNWKSLEKLTNVSVRPIQSLLNQGEYTFDDFVDLVDQYLNKTPIDQLMDAPICTGTLKIQKPSLYIFPAGQGDSCYFAINGFTMLINGGFDRLKPCFWKFVNMLEQIDAVLVTHTDSDSLGGLTSLFQKKAANVGVKPRISVILGNLISSHNSHNLHSSPNKAANLIINELPNCSGNKSDSDLILEAIERLQIKLQPLVIQRPLTEKVKLHYDHYKLYYKAHYGSLDLYLLTPNVQSTEFKDFCVQQQTMISKMHKSNLAFQHVYRNLPSSHLASSVCLLVWQPSYKVDSTNTALRLLFTGNCPQNVLFNALDRLKDFDLLVHPVYKIKSDLDQNQQFYNALRKETKVNKESAPSKLNSSMSKSNGDAKNTTNKAARPAKPTSAPVPSSKKSDTSFSKPPVGDKKPSSASTRQSMNGTSAPKASKPVEVAKKTAVAKQPAKPAVPRQVPAKSELAKKTALNAAKPPIKKDVKNSKASSADHAQSDATCSELVSEQITENDTNNVEADCVEINEQNQQSINGSKKTSKESATSKLNSSMSKSNGDAKNTTNKAARPAKPTSAPVSAKKTDNSTNKPPVGDKKPSSASTRQSMNGSATSKVSKTAEIAKKSANAKPPVKKETKTSKSLSLSIDPVQSEQSTAEPVSETLVERKEEVVIEENFVNNVVVIENENVEQIEQVEQVENVEVVEQVIEQQVVEHEQEVVECESNHFDHDRMHDQELAEPVEEKRADQVVSEIDDSRNLEIDDQVDQQEMVPLEQQQQETTPIQNVNQSVEQQEIEPLEQQQEITPVQIDQPLVDLDEVTTIREQHQHQTNPIVEQQSETNSLIEQQNETSPVVEQQSEANPLVEQQHQEVVSLEQQQQQESAVIEENSKVQNEQDINQQQQEINTVINELMIEQNETREVQNGELVENFEQETEKAYSNESPNLSPVKKDFCEQNGFGEHTNAPVSEDQISSVENANLDENTDEIVSGNIENREHACKDDIMTRSFIEDASDPTSNPFNPVKTLNESCDLNRTHELFQDEESCNTSKTEEIANGVETVKVENTETHQIQQVSSNEQPSVVENLVEQPMATNSPVEQPSPILVNSESLTVSSSKRPVAPVSPSQTSDVKTMKNTSISQKSARSSGPLHPVYVELAFIPAHGHPSYVDADFFKRVRARHYVLSAIDFGEHILNALLDGKETWDDRNLQVTLVPTYESDLLRRWFENNQERLARLKVEITPAARHSIVTVDENPDLNCPAYKLEF